MHTRPNEIDAAGGSIDASTLFAAWNAATYVARIEDERLAAAMRDDACLTATRDVLLRHGCLWFRDESFVIARKRDVT
jgi:G:T-mismatch repair DNA endonuclease (very short patch repair protein)